MGWNGIPIIASNMDTVGTIECADALAKFDMMTWLHKFNTKEQIEKANCNWTRMAITVGEEEINSSVIPNNIGIIRIDAANGYREEFVDIVKRVRNTFPGTPIFAGNVCTPEMTQELLLAGADVVVIGIGSGGHCTTRIKAGVGFPQLSAVIDCADAAHGLGGHIASDGGCRTPGDICKAFAGGADFVVLGSMLAAHKENTPKENIYKREFIKNGVEMVEVVAEVYGMSSKTAQNKHYGGVSEHRTSEGKTSWIPFRGPIETTIKDILGGLRSCCTYVGAKSLKELSKRTTFVRVNQVRNKHFDEYKIDD
jgi:GMP reductase